MTKNHVTVFRPTELAFPLCLSHLCSSCTSNTQDFLFTTPFFFRTPILPTLHPLLARITRGLGTSVVEPPDRRTSTLYEEFEVAKSETLI